MSLQINDENLGELITADPFDFQLTTPHTSGRSSILRPSQKDNLLPKSTGKPIKVTFQTPMRDPQTRKILFSDMAKMLDISTLDNCMDGLENPQLNTAASNAKNIDLSETVGIHSENIDAIQPAPYPDDELPVKSLGAYNIDFDNLEDIDPFGSSSQVQNSLPKLVKSPVKVSKCPKESFPENSSEVLLDAFLVDPVVNNFDPKFMSSEVEVSPEEADTVIVFSNEMVSSNDILQLAVTEGDVPFTDPFIFNEKNMDPFASAGKIQNSPPKTSYRFDPNKIDSINPFKSEVSKLQNSPSESSETAKPEPMKLEFDFSDGSTIKKPPPKKLGKRLGDKVLHKKAVTSKEPLEKPISVKPDEEDIPIPKVSYKLEWDQFDDPNFNPFGGGSKISNSPKLLLGDTVEVKKGEESAETMSRNQAITLNFAADENELHEKEVEDENAGTRKVPVSKMLKEAAASEGKKETLRNSKPHANDLPVSEASYKFDPNFNPFGGGSKICNSPKQSVEDTTEVKDETRSKEQPITLNLAAAQNEIHENTPTGDTPVKNLPSSGDVMEEKPVAALTVKDTVLKLSNTTGHATNEDKLALENITKSHLEETEKVKTEFFVKTADRMFINDPTTPPASDFSAELFKPATEIQGFDQPIEIDYLEQFGTTSFQESVLRKQSLYLKFDPLLRDSPRKSAPCTTQSRTYPVSALPRSCSSLLALESLMETENPGGESVHIEEKPKGLDLLGTFPVAGTAILVPDTSPADSTGISPFLLPTTTAEDAIFEILKYSQKDMDAAIEKVRLEVREKELETLELKKKNEKLHAEYLEMGKIVAEFEGVITGMLGAPGTPELIAQIVWICEQGGVGPAQSSPGPDTAHRSFVASKASRKSYPKLKALTSAAPMQMPRTAPESRHLSPTPIPELAEAGDAPVFLHSDSNTEPEAGTDSGRQTPELSPRSMVLEARLTSGQRPCESQGGGS
nr:PREDICTED: transforming acidic coiled-coil-containing protein 3 [Latimeria chalumnae]|eukprot:XP_014344311.1 PREDICTED: transforming acidic coiled-coil-containing protein 3 [Latimeria chalumnae]